MKKVFLVALLAVFFISCSVGDDTQNSFSLLPIYQFDVPTTFKVDSVSVFNVRYKRVNDCQIYNGLYFDQSDNTTKIAVKVVELQEANCNPDNETTYEVPLNFKPSQSGTYILKFWNGKDPNGVDQFSNTEIIVP